MAEFSIKHGDCLGELRLLGADSVDALVTDPPAGISFMGKEWDSHKGGRDQWIAWLTEVMRECMRVLKPGAHGLVWAIPRTSHWTATALENAGFEVRDVITHHFGSGFPKSLDISKAIDKAAGAERKNLGIRVYA
ncbi:MAG: DNA methyltransferase, partial [Shewanella sp.]